MGHATKVASTGYEFNERENILDYTILITNNADTGVRNGKISRDAAFNYLKGKWKTMMPEAMFNQEWIKIDPLSKKVPLLSLSLLSESLGSLDLISF